MSENRHKTLSALFLLILLMSYKVGVTMFVHTHNVDGTMVVHSHPFTSNNHSHSSTQVIAIGQLSSFNGLENTSYNEINVFHYSVEEINFSEQNLFVINACDASVSLRAPPAVC